MDKIKLFLDHDGTITHFDKTHRMWILEETFYN